MVAVTDWRLWRAALAARVTGLLHWISGHTVAWSTASGDLPRCSGDIVCRSCRQVLWCRAYDPWRVGALEGGPPPNDHWGGTHPEAAPGVVTGQHEAALVDAFTHVLTLAERLPSGASEDHVRRSVCELIEADSGAARHAKVDRLLNSISQLQQARTSGRRRVAQAGSAPIERLLEALRRDVLPILRQPGF